MSENTAVVPKNFDPLAEFLPAGFSGDEGAEENISPPIYTIGQGTGGQSPDMAGKLICKSNGDIRDKIEISLVRSNWTRTFFSSSYDDDSNAIPRCKSLDGKIPDLEYFLSDRVIEKIGDATPVCSKCVNVVRTGSKSVITPVCPKAAWKKDKHGRSYSDCSEGRRLLCVDLEKNMPFLFDFKGLSMVRKPDSGEEYMTFFQAYAQMALKKPFYRHRLTIIPGQKKSPKGTKFVARFQVSPQLLTTDELLEIKEMVMMLAEFNEEHQRAAEKVNDQPDAGIPDDAPDEDTPY